jgi:hypothetical protein
MRPVHRRLLDVARAALCAADPSPATPEQLAAAEARLGRPLPPGYRAFLAEVGHVSWPLVIRNVVDFGEGLWPAHFVPFADDGGGNLYGFDLRGKKGRELPIDHWDHEEPTVDDEPGPPERFQDWLEARLDEEVRRTVAERRDAVAARLGANHVDDALAPDDAQITEVEGALGVTLPEDYVWFTSTFGALRWPVRIVDALSLADLTTELRERRPGEAGRVIAFASEGDSGFAAFDRHGRVRGFGLVRPAPGAFLDYLEDRLSHAPAAGPPPRAAEDEELALAERLLARLHETGQLETTRGFPAEAVARRIADAWGSPARILSILMDRADVIEVYVSEEELAVLQLDVKRPPEERHG